jgi:glutathione S-transferase
VAGSKPVLWQIRISHYSEKVRWALDLKGVEHDRHAPLPGYHIVVALALTRGRHYTLPVLKLDGPPIGDSTVIIAALEARRPDPPLYPADPGERRRALDLEDFFDEYLGPAIRRFVFHEARRDRRRFARVAAEEAPGPLGRLGPLTAGYMRVFTAVRYRAASERASEQAGRKVLAALDRLESELGDDDYLVGERFTVADLTAAALFYPLVTPPDGPRLPPAPAGYEEFRAPLRDRRGYRWVEEMFRRHRKPTADRVPAAG